MIDVWEEKSTSLFKDTHGSKYLDILDLYRNLKVFFIYMCLGPIYVVY